MRYHIIMVLKIKVNSSAYDADYGGDQKLALQRGEFQLDEIFRLPFFRVIIDDIIGDALCFRLMEGAVAHYFVLEGPGDSAVFERQTSIGSDEFLFELEEE